MDTYRTSGSTEPVKKPAVKYYRYCVTGQVRLRDDPSLKGKVLGLLNKGEKVGVLTKSREKTPITYHGAFQNHHWFRIRRTDGKEGWTYGLFLSKHLFTLKRDINNTWLFPLGWQVSCLQPSAPPWVKRPLCFVPRFFD